MSDTLAPVQPVQNDRSGMATASMVLGICAAVTGIIPLIGILAFILGPLAIVFGALALRSSKRGQAIAGLATGGTGLVISALIAMLMIIGFAADAGNY